MANRHGHTCLMIACYKGHFKIAKYLIEIGADVNRKSVKGNTALHDCAESGSLDIMKLLLISGARIDVDAYGMTPLLAASVTGQPGHSDLLRVGFSNCDFDVGEGEGALVPPPIRNHLLLVHSQFRNILRPF